MDVVKRHSLLEYLRRLIREVWAFLTVVLTGLLAFVLERVVGVPIPLEAVVAVGLVALVLASYRVFAGAVQEREAELSQLRAERDDLAGKLREIEARRPRLVVGFMDGEHLVQRLVVKVTGVTSPDEDLDAAVEQKRLELFAKGGQRPARQGLSTDRILDDLMAAMVPNPDYHTEVEAFLVRYREYLCECHEARIAKDRLKSIQLVVENRGRHVADTVKLDLALPSIIPTPTWRQSMYGQREADEEKVPSPPDEPKPFVSRMQLLGFGFGHTGLGFSIAGLLPAGRSEVAARLPKPVRGPEYEEGGTRATCEIARLNPGDVEYGLAPLPLWLANVHLSYTYEIIVKVKAAQLPEPEEQRLALEVRVEVETPPLSAPTPDTG